MALKLGMNVRDDGRCSEDSDLLTDDDLVSYDYKSEEGNSGAYRDRLTIDQ